MKNMKEVSENLLDEEKTRAFQRAIKNTIKLGDIVLDCGCGTVLFANLCNNEGAKVISFEKDKEVFSAAQKNISENITLINADVASHKTNVNAVIIDLMDTMLVHGEQVRVLNALCGKKIINAYTKTIPIKISNFFELVGCDFEFFDEEIILPIQSVKMNDRCIAKFSSSVMYNEVYMNKRISSECVYDGKHLIYSKGWLNAVKFSSVATLTEDILLGQTSNFLQPIFYPVKEMMVRPGDVIRVKINYKMGGGFKTLSVALE